MCGIAGIQSPHGLPPEAEPTVLRMLASIRHRGPDEHGVYLDRDVALGSVRLSILDLASGQQPIANEDETRWIVFNGEIFNHVDLRAELEALGHRFATRTDTEVVLHAYEEFGPECLSRFNGQFAVAIWDESTRRLFVARDRLGVRPLFYARCGGRFYFASEIKALFNAVPFARRLNPAVLRNVFTYWSPLPGDTVFEAIHELPPGHYAMVDGDSVQITRYWQLHFLDPASDRTRYRATSEPALKDQLRDLLLDATRVRLRADVPVGAYLSGGLDSSLIAALIRHCTPSRLRTFSIAFTDSNFDERDHQRLVARFLGTEHEVLEATHADIGRVFPDVIWHTEVPTLRTAPAPMFMLSHRVRTANFKVVLTGEGADEFLAGYDIFKEARIRAFWAREPDSTRRPRLLQRLYPEIFGPTPTSGFLAAFFREGLANVDSVDYSHCIRWRNTRRTWRFLNQDLLDCDSAVTDGAIASLLPPQFASWGTLERAQFLESSIFLPEYLLSSQGDRVAMAHSIEGRFPFLDHRVVEFCNALPSRHKLRGLREKHLLREVARAYLPGPIVERRKRPYRAPIHRCFFHAHPPDYVREVLSDAALRRAGLFRPAAVTQLCAKLLRGGALGETDDMALAGIISTQLLYHLFVANFSPASAASLGNGGKIVRRCAAPGSSR